MFRKIVIVCQLWILSACTINNLHYNLHEMAVREASQPIYRVDKPQAPAIVVLKPTQQVAKVSSISTDCRNIAFPDLKLSPEPPIKEIEAIDPKNRAKIYQIMIVYTGQLQQANKDARVKYLTAKSAYMRKCLQ